MIVMAMLIGAGLVEAGMLVVGCARRLDNIEKLASQLTQHKGKVDLIRWPHKCYFLLFFPTFITSYPTSFPFKIHIPYIFLYFP
jgi:hypothetical protein